MKCPAPAFSNQPNLRPFSKNAHFVPISVGQKFIRANPCLSVAGFSLISENGRLPTPPTSYPAYLMANPEIKVAAIAGNYPYEPCPARYRTVAVLGDGLSSAPARAPAEDYLNHP